MKLRSIEMVLPQAEAAANYLTDIWGAALAGIHNNTFYIRGSGTFAYLVALEEGEEKFVRSITWECESDELAALKQRLAKLELKTKPIESDDLGGGQGILVELAEGEVFRFLTGSEHVEPLQGKDLPVKLTHVVCNSIDAEASGHLVEEALGFTVSDRTKGMVFVRCNQSHHSTAFARSGFASLNHIAFEMEDVDAVMRGIGRLRDNDTAPAWGPGRHGPGANVFAYFIAPFGAVVEFSTAVEIVPDDYQAGAPEDWTWPPKRIDQWGISDKDFDGLKQAEQQFCFRRDWQPEAIS
ncbi:VOC family protein [Halioxenophilus aromaticivorans]|uniref:VOC family protein n=1 Tax=Halioxenophilus aromaticivorans TaxID=1306992 RepID=A0AAV3U2X7_9ALTE